MFRRFRVNPAKFMSHPWYALSFVRCRLSEDGRVSPKSKIQIRKSLDPPPPLKYFPTLESCTLATFPPKNPPPTVSQGYRRNTCTPSPPSLLPSLSPSPLTPTGPPHSTQIENPKSKIQNPCRFPTVFKKKRLAAIPPQVPHRTAQDRTRTCTGNEYPTRPST